MEQAVTYTVEMAESLCDEFVACETFASNREAFDFMYSLWKDDDYDPELMRLVDSDSNCEMLND